ncbi:MAG: primosomal protein N' [Candidatus Aminicenantes bacterium]|nr:primosomal protein N' [Candidatus Aminicenantes bacterium]
MNYYKVALPVPIPSLFTYYSEEQIQPGTIVRVNFRGKTLQGVVWERTLPEEFQVKPILTIYQERISHQMMRLAEKLEEIYLHPRGMYAQLMVPPGRLSPDIKKFAPTPEGIFCAIDGNETEKKLITLLLKVPYTKTYIRRKLGKRIDYYLRKLLSLSFIIGFEEESKLTSWSGKRDPYLFPQIPHAEIDIEGKNAAEEIKKSLGKFSTHLLFGVTGSGKSFVLLDVIEEVINKGGGVIYLVPEISMVPFPYQLLSKKFGNVEVIHSLQTRGMKSGSWERLKRGESKIALGPRSALFAPVKNLMLIVVDEEHDLSYDQETSPRYRTLDVAIERAKIEDATVVLSTATPSIETYYRAKKGEFALHKITRRLNNLPLPRAAVISMRKKKHLISDEFARALEEEYARGNQALVLMNRRGFSSYYYCPQCGYVALCPHCEIPLTYHKEENYLECHYCGYREQPPSVCPHCDSEMKPAGAPGLQRLVESFRDRFPDLRVERFDADVGRSKKRARQILRDFYDGKINVLVGTQLISKGHNFPGVTLVGVFFPDLLLNFPDFTASERTFQLITQMIGRAGRTVEGKAFVQTNFPEHHAIKLAAEQDYEAFFLREIELRRKLLYPPFVKLVRILIEDKDRKNLGEKSRKIFELLKDFRKRGPAMAPFKKLAGKWRAHIFVEFEGESHWEEFKKLYRQNFHIFRGTSIIVSPSQVL